MAAWQQVHDQAAKDEGNGNQGDVYLGRQGKGDETCQQKTQSTASEQQR